MVVHEGRPMTTEPAEDLLGQQLGGLLLGGHLYSLRAVY